ncbi:MAG: DUF748 domain-containing protein, partial [Campylobacter sp.]|nr:DUF748 domain-containing protein [Campylobacter sp.]
MLKSVVPHYLQDKNATLLIQKVKFHPYKFELNATGVSLSTYTKLFGVKELDFSLNFSKIFSRNINIETIRLKEPYVNIVREHNLSFNFDSLVMGDEDAQSDDSESFFNLTLHKFKIIKGDVSYADKSLKLPFKFSLNDLNYEIADVNLKQQSIGKHILGTNSSLFDTFDWKGGVGLKPLSFYGEINFSGLKLDKIWQSYMNEMDQNLSKGFFDTTFKYVVSIDEKGVGLGIKDANFVFSKLNLKDVNSSLSLDKIAFYGFNLGGNFSGKNELKFSLFKSALNGLKFDDVSLKAAEIGDVKLAISSDENLSSKGELGKILLEKIAYKNEANVDKIELNDIK